MSTDLFFVLYTILRLYVAIFLILHMFSFQLLIHLLFEMVEVLIGLVDVVLDFATRAYDLLVNPVIAVYDALVVVNFISISLCFGLNINLI